MGHVKFGHTRLGLLLGGPDTGEVNLPFPLNLVARARALIFLWWARTSEMTADRAGIVACGRPSKAISAQVKVSVGPTLWQHVQFTELARQSADLHSGVGRLEGVLSQLGAAHPYLTNRIRAMLEFVSSNEMPVAGTSDEALPGRIVERWGRSTVAVHDLDGRRLIVGRSRSADVQVVDRSVSRRHLEIAWRDGAYVLRDLGSHNGTFVNGERVEHAVLRAGDTVRLGHTEFDFSVQA
jgi:hypothetical protein